MKPDLEAKIQRLTYELSEPDEDQVRSLAVLLRKRLEMADDQPAFPTLNLFCNWAMHTRITTSLAGLMTLARVNDALVSYQSAHTNKLILKSVEAIGLDTLRDEIETFLDKHAILHKFDDDKAWMNLVTRLVEIIRDVPITFPKKLSKKQQDIYDVIAKNPFKSGGGVVSLTLSYQDHVSLRIRDKDYTGALGLTMHLQDGTPVMVPLLMAFRRKRKT